MQPAQTQGFQTYPNIAFGAVPRFLLWNRLRRPSTFFLTSFLHLR